MDEALKKRRTVRRFAHRELDLAQVSQLLWGTDGISDPRGLRTAPSAGATYPLEIYLVVGERGVTGLTPACIITSPTPTAWSLPRKETCGFLWPGPR